MVSYRASPDHAPPQVVEKIDWTVIAPNEDCELTQKQKNQLESGSVKQHESGTRSSIPSIRPVRNFERAHGDDYISWMTIDVGDLWRLIYEHRRYAYAKGFSDSEMDVLRAIEFNRNERVMMGDIEEDFRIEHYAESTVYKALGNLVEKGLIEKVGRGVYQYIGP